MCRGWGEVATAPHHPRSSTIYKAQPISVIPSIQSSQTPHRRSTTGGGGLSPTWTWAGCGQASALLEVWCLLVGEGLGLALPRERQESTLVHNRQQWQGAKKKSIAFRPRPFRTGARSKMSRWFRCTGMKVVPLISSHLWQICIGTGRTGGTLKTKRSHHKVMGANYGSSPSPN